MAELELGLDAVLDDPIFVFLLKWLSDRAPDMRSRYASGLTTS
jgi:hypothetical protein